MAWIEIDPEKLRWMPAEREALDEAAAEAGNATPLEAIAQAVARRIRGRCRAANITLDEGAHTIPDELEDAALTILRYKALTAFPSVAGRFLDENRREEYQAAEKELADLAAGKISVEAAETATEETAETGISSRPKLSSRTRKMSPADSDGL